MSKKRQLFVGAINITLPKPHNADRYVALWGDLFALKKPISIHGDIHLIIGQAVPVCDLDPSQGFRGYFVKYIEIDKTRPWFNQRTVKEADPQLVTQEVKLPDYLKPNMRTFEYRFFPVSHRLIFESKLPKVGNLSPTFVERALSQLAASPNISRLYEDLHITAEQDTTGVSKILHSDGLQELTIVIKRPNSGDDDSDNDEAAIEKELDEQGAREQVTTYKAKSRSKGIKPNARTTAMANVAKSNGRVDGRIKLKNGKTKKVSSTETPLLESERYDPDQTTITAAFDQLAMRVAKGLRSP